MKASWGTIRDPGEKVGSLIVRQGVQSPAQDARVRARTRGGGTIRDPGEESRVPDRAMSELAPTRNDQGPYFLTRVPDRSLMPDPEADTDFYLEGINGRIINYHFFSPAAPSRLGAKVVNKVVPY